MSLTSYSPVRRFTQDPKVFFSRGLHVLGVPPAFVLSQDQTLQLGVAQPKAERLQIYPLEFFLVGGHSCDIGRVGSVRPYARRLAPRMDRLGNLPIPACRHTKTCTADGTNHP